MRLADELVFDYADLAEEPVIQVIDEVQPRLEQVQHQLDGLVFDYDRAIRDGADRQALTLIGDRIRRVLDDVESLADSMPRDLSTFTSLGFTLAREGWKEDSRVRLDLFEYMTTVAVVAGDGNELGRTDANTPKEAFAAAMHAIDEREGNTAGGVPERGENR